MTTKIFRLYQYLRGMKLGVLLKTVTLYNCNTESSDTHKSQ